MSWIEWSATVFGILYVVLMIRRNILCWIAGNISVVLQAVSFYRVKLYADMTLQVIYFAAGCYGLWKWWKKPMQPDTVEVFYIRTHTLKLVLLVVWGIGSITWAFVLRGWTDAALPEIDASLATASLIATWLQAHKYVENWVLWIVIDVAYAIVYLLRGLELYVMLYAVFVVLAWMGWKQWRGLIHE
ncbi:MAG: nicotinamide riboside transporter PnuC [Chlorobi bacterium]|nr:nicotinamide riboside transporter PnuC [Chlorobiota bacterium]